MIYNWHFLRNLISGETQKEISQGYGTNELLMLILKQFKPLLMTWIYWLLLYEATNTQIIDKFKESFPPEIISQLLDHWWFRKFNYKSTSALYIYLNWKQTVAANVLAHATQELPVGHDAVSNTVKQKSAKAPIGSKWNTGCNCNTGTNRGARNHRSNNFQSDRPSYNFHFPHDMHNSSQQQFPQNDRGPNYSNPRNQRTRGRNLRGQRGAFYNPRNQYRGNYRYRYPNYKNQRNFQGSRYERQIYNRNPQMRQNDYNYDMSIRPWHFNNYMRQKEEYDDAMNYNEGQRLQAEFQCWQCHKYGHYTHQCENAWSQVMDLCDSLGQASLKEEVQNHKYYADNPQQENHFQ